jgi:hypothetical protein
VLDRRPQLANVLRSGSWLRSHTGRLLSGLGLVAISPELSDAARKGDRHDDNQVRKNDDPGNNRNDRDEKTQDERDSSHQNDRNASAEDHNTGEKSGTSEKQRQNESRSENDDKRNQSESDSGKSRDDSQHQNADSSSNSRGTSGEDDDSHHHRDRHVQEFEQQADAAPVDDVPDSIDTTPANPNDVIDNNDVIDSIPSTSINDLVVNANDDVIASTTGGFAFARSGDVIAVSGPDGASIVQTGNATTGTNGTGPAPVEPSPDGGDNNMDFSS